MRASCRFLSRSRYWLRCQWVRAGQAPIGYPDLPFAARGCGPAKLVVPEFPLRHTLT